MQNIKKEIYYNDKCKKYSNQIVLSNKSMQNNTNAVFLQKETHTSSFTQQTHSFNLQFFAKKDPTQKKKKYLPLIISLIIIIALAIASIPVISIVTKKDTKAFKYNDTTNYVEVGELWDSSTKKFNATNLNTLISYLSTGYTSDTDVTATDIRGYTANGKTSSQAVVVTLGGLKWQVVYLTTVNGQRTATLWLTSNEQDAFAGKSSTEGAYYGYLQSSTTGKTGLYSDWSANWADSSYVWTYNFPNSMYGTSYIRAVTLNNGGVYSTGYSSTSYVDFDKTTSGKDSAFKYFTIESYGLTNFIVKPNTVNYQTQAQYNKGGVSYNLMNDSLSKVTDNLYSSSKTFYSSPNFDAYYAIWGSDNLWLPSIQETGSSGVNGVWQINVNERMSYNGSSSSTVGSVGTASGAAYPYSWLRSSSKSYPDDAYYLYTTGGNASVSGVENTYAVRPALHLNLESAWLTTLTFKVTTTSAGEGMRVIYGDGTVSYGSSRTISAYPSDGYVFDYWLVNGTKVTTDSYSFTVTEDTTAVAYFKKASYVVTVKSNDTTQGTVSGGGTMTFQTRTTITAIPNEDYVFLGWKRGTYDDYVSKNASYTFNVGANNVTYTAYFQIKTFAVSVSAGNTGGNVSAGNIYDLGTNVALTATPKIGYAFDYWLINGVKQTANPYSFTVTQDITAVAYFLDQVSITSPNTTLSLISYHDECDFVNYCITPVTTNFYIYSIQVDNNKVQVLKSRQGVLNYSGASAYIQYTVNEDNKLVTIKVMRVRDDINITLNYTTTNQNLPNQANLIPGVAVTANEGGEARIVGNDIANGEDTDIVVLAAVPYTGYTFAGWVNGNDETEKLGTENQLSIRLTKAQINGKIVKAVFVKNTSNINDETNNTDDIL